MHGPDNQIIYLNPDMVTNYRRPRGEGHFAQSTNCLVFLADGKYVGTVETCEQIKKIIQDTTK